MKVEWQSESTQQDFVLLSRIGWLAFFSELGIWVALAIKFRNVKPAISRFGFVLACVAACVIGIIILALIGPSASCPELAGIIVDNIAPAWPAILVSLASIGIGIVGLAIRSAQNDQSSQAEQRAS